jgi:hypothetical protein
MSPYSDWRSCADPLTIFALDFYAEWLVGQTVGMSDALNLLAVKAAMEMDGIQNDDMTDLTTRCFVVHAELMKIVKRKKKKNG